MEDIDSLIVHTLKACQAVMINDRHCFELYGYDIIVDDALKPWLIEVNVACSLSSSSPLDKLIKHMLMTGVPPHRTTTSHAM